MSGEICAQCKHYLGCGDWDMCCKKQEERLCYEDTPAYDCASFEQMEKCINASSDVGMFRCSICGAYCREERVFHSCPACDSPIEGAHWGGQKHWTGARP